jgi:hypothetical protein
MILYERKNNLQDGCQSFKKKYKAWIGNLILLGKHCTLVLLNKIRIPSKQTLGYPTLNKKMPMTHNKPLVPYNDEILLFQHNMDQRFSK